MANVDPGPSDVNLEGRQILVHDEKNPAGPVMDMQQQKELEETNAAIIEKQKQKEYEEEKKRRQEDEEKLSVLILGSKHIASWIIHKMRKDAKFVVVSTNDTAEIFYNPYVKHSVNRKLVQGYNISEFDMERNLENIIDANKFDFIIDTLSVHGAEYSVLNPMRTQYVNVMTTQAIMNAIGNAHHNASLVYLSTDKVYGDQGCPSGVGPDDANVGDKYHARFKITEKDIPNPLGIRAISRFNQENTVVQMCKTLGINYINLRVSNMYGPYTPRDSVWNNFYETALRDGFINVYGDKYASRDFVPIEQVAKLIRNLTVDYDGSMWGDTYNIGGNYPTRQFIDGIAMFIQTIIAGSEVVGLRPDYDQYIKKYGSVKRRYLPARCFEDKEEAKIRIWLDCKKAAEKLKYDPRADQQEELVMKTQLLFVAQYYLGLEQDAVQGMKMKISR